MRPTFKSFLLNEDLASDVLNIQTQLSTLQAKKANQDKSIDGQIINLQNQLAQKQKMLSAQTKQPQPTQQTQAPAAQNAPGTPQQPAVGQPQ